METRLFNRLAGVPLSGFSLAGASGFEGGEIPHDAPMAMPIQTLRRRDYEPAPGSVGRQGGRALALVAATLALTGPATFALWSALGVDSLGLLDLLILLAFTPLFAWTAFSFVSALAGLLAPPSDAVCLGLDPRTPARRPDSRTAILMPVYNEAPAPVFARLQAMFTSLRAAGGGGTFDFFVLSDTHGQRYPAPRSTLISWRCAAAWAPGRGCIYRHRADQHRPQGRQHRQLGAPVRRRLRLHGHAGRRQPDGGRDPDAPGDGHGAPSRGRA